MSIEDSSALLLRVVAGVCVREAKVMIAKRPEHKAHGGFWEFPGGKVNSEAEGDEEALRREFIEEFGVAISVEDYLCAVPLCDEALPSRQIGTLHVYFARIVGAQLELREHQAIAWVLPAALASFRLAEADLQVAGILAPAHASKR